MAIGRPTKPLNVTPEEKEKFSMLARRPKSAVKDSAMARWRGVQESREQRYASGGSDFE